MKSTKVVEKKYKGYLIKPSIQGFKVYRKDYYIDTYGSVQIAKSRIDHAVRKKKELAGKTEPADEMETGAASSQTELF